MQNRRPRRLARRASRLLTHKEHLTHRLAGGFSQQGRLRHRRRYL